MLLNHSCRNASPNLIITRAFYEDCVCCYNSIFSNNQCTSVTYYFCSRTYASFLPMYYSLKFRLMGIREYFVHIAFYYRSLDGKLFRYPL